ncbi:hypothetical protein Hanom_Chr04g00348491 [Helianthus anomalus]
MRASCSGSASSKQTARSISMTRSFPLVTGSFFPVVVVAGGRWRVVVVPVVGI